MTSKKGTLWKTSWNRARGTPEPAPVAKMRFFTDFEKIPTYNCIYETPGNLTLLGATLPFWVAMVGIGNGGQRMESVEVINNFNVSSAIPTISGAGNFDSGGFTASLTAVGSSYVAAAVCIIKDVVPGVSFSVRGILDNQVSSYDVRAAPFSPPANPLSLIPGTASGGLHGFAGGPFEPTLAEVNQWFLDLKATGQIQDIPGKTSHRYSAASVVGVPVLLPNLGSAGAAQDMDLITLLGNPNPQNVETLVRFSY